MSILKRKTYRKPLKWIGLTEAHRASLKRVEQETDIGLSPQRPRKTTHTSWHGRPFWLWRTLDWDRLIGDVQVSMRDCDSQREAWPGFTGLFIDWHIKMKAGSFLGDVLGASNEKRGDLFCAGGDFLGGEREGKSLHLTNVTVPRIEKGVQIVILCGRYARLRRRNSTRFCC